MSDGRCQHATVQELLRIIVPWPRPSLTGRGSGLSANPNGFPLKYRRSVAQSGQEISNALFERHGVVSWDPVGPISGISTN